MTFAQKLRELRDAKGLSEVKLAEASGVTYSAVHQYGLGRRMPSLPAAVKLAKALGVTCDVFADCEDVVGAEAEESAPKRGRARTDRPSAQAPSPKKPRGKGKK